MPLGRANHGERLRAIDQHALLASALAMIAHQPISVVADAAGLADDQVGSTQTGLQGIVFAFMFQKAPASAFHQLPGQTFGVAISAHAEHGAAALSLAGQRADPFDQVFDLPGQRFAARQSGVVAQRLAFLIGPGHAGVAQHDRDACLEQGVFQRGDLLGLAPQA
ncbi:hypothetical protein BAV0781 [Bordetella avium 197N]|uniref:Uncharacterized protein n=1 Tax=Bordetella avium (strain 197N) TaxID=360910 RepID=Q2KWQ5_BORA1|nr:hypothetical protein BAV0781 [Bordetella avium 197N]